jgi:Bacterial self-protective colicin-like immunity
MDPFPQIQVLDFVRLMKDFLDGRVGVKDYQRQYFELNTKRVILSEEESKILQQAYGDADDFDDAVQLAYTINEEQLKERVSVTLERLRRLGHPIARL